MNRLTLSLLAVSVLWTGTVRAENSSATPPVVVKPTVPAPPVAAAPESGPVVGQNSAAPSAAAPATGVTQIVYSPRLPSAGEITSAAAAQGIAVERIVQTANQVIAFYRNAGGQTSTVAYQTLPPSAAPAPAAAPAPVVVTAPPTVVYQTAPRVVYYDYPGYYYPRMWYPPVSFSFGVGYSRGYYHGGHRHRR